MRRLTRVAISCCAALAVLSMPPLAAQDAAPTEIEVEGTGESEQLALENALQEAIRRTVGVVEQDRTASRHLALVNANVHQMFSASSSDTDTATRIVSATKGIVQNYRVLEHQREEDGHRVKVAAKVARFDATRLRAEPFTVVMLPIRAAAGTYLKDVDGESQRTALDLAPLAQRLRQTAETCLVQSKAFQVLDRVDLRLADDELQRIRSGECPAADLARLQQRLSADYLLLGEIRAATARLELRSMSVPGWSGRVGHEFELAYTLLEVPTGRIVKSGAIASSHWPEQRGVVPSGELDLDAVFGDLAARAVPHLVDAFVDDLDPILVARVQQRDGKALATLTQGGSRFAVGDRFVVIEEGEPLLHPRTGAVLGRDETVRGELTIVDTSGPLAIGELTTGGDAVARGAVVRRKPAQGVTLR